MKIKCPLEGIRNQLRTLIYVMFLGSKLKIQNNQSAMTDPVFHDVEKMTFEFLFSQNFRKYFMQYYNFQTNQLF